MIQNCWFCRHQFWNWGSATETYLRGKYSILPWNTDKWSEETIMSTKVHPRPSINIKIVSRHETKTSEVKKLSSQPRLLIKIKIVTRHETKKSDERLYDIKSTKGSPKAMPFPGTFVSPSVSAASPHTRAGQTKLVFLFKFCLDELPSVPQPYPI